jgi:hypothetical protein
MQRDTKEERKERRGEEREERRERERERRERGERKERERGEREREERERGERKEKRLKSFTLYLPSYFLFVLPLLLSRLFFFPDLSKVKILIHTRCKLYQVYANNIAFSGTSF